MSVLAHHWNTNGAGPVEVEMSQLVGQDLDLSRLKSTGVFNYIIRRGVDRSLAHGLRNQVEIVPLRQGDNVVKYGATGWIDVVALLRIGFFEESAVDTFGHHDVGEGRLDVVLLEQLLDFHDLLVFDQLNLPVANAITVHDDSSGKFLVDLFVPEKKNRKNQILKEEF